jgi:hypothetical protein
VRFKAIFNSQLVFRYISASLLLLCPSVFAQIEVIEETATKRSEEQHKVAISMQALDAENIETLQVKTADQILDHLANVGRNATNNVNAGFSIRGVGTNNWHGNVSRAVGLYIDEVSLSTPYSGVLSVWRLPSRVSLPRHLLIRKPHLLWRLALVCMLNAVYFVTALREWAKVCYPLSWLIIPTPIFSSINAT